MEHSLFELKVRISVKSDTLEVIPYPSLGSLSDSLAQVQTLNSLQIQ